MGGFRTAKSNPAVVATAVCDDGERAVADGSSDGAVRISRREVVTGGVAVAALLALGGTGVALAGERQLLRPPGGQDEGRLWGACIKCDRCRSACPHGAIDVAHLEDGIVNRAYAEDELPQRFLRLLLARWGARRRGRWRGAARPAVRPGLPHGRARFRVRLHARWRQDRRGARGRFRVPTVPLGIGPLLEAVRGSMRVRRAVVGGGRSSDGR